MTVEQIKAELKKMIPEFARRVAPIYQLLDWKWSPGDSKPYVPTVKTIEKAIYEAIKRLSEEICSSDTGGVEAYYELPDEGNPGEYGLMFIFSKEEFFN